MYELIFSGLAFLVFFVVIFYWFYWLYRRWGVPPNEILTVRISSKDNIRHRIVKFKRFNVRKGELVPNKWYKWYRKHGKIIKRVKLNESSGN